MQTLNKSLIKSFYMYTSIQKDARGEKKDELNQEDIEAVEFLASEFSKETTTKNVELKVISEMETVDSTMLEVASVQGINHESEEATQCDIVSDSMMGLEVIILLLLFCITDEKGFHYDLTETPRLKLSCEIEFSLSFDALCSEGTLMDI